MMMVGLPASGKSTWAEKWMKEHPEKRYVLLGTNLALDQMKVYVLFLLFLTFRWPF
jgi:heterogeneous nuclear ribonucleoprotein U-like protein 1